jgi:branched-subunit amino acid aminotransferase/4-amino-4-deoxychorismate lyase
MDQREVTVPEHPSATLPGITRQWAMNELAGLGTIANPRHAVYEEVLDCEEIMLTNSSWGVLPITRVADRTIGTGTPGPIAQQLVERWSRHVKSASGV